MNFRSLLRPRVNFKKKSTIAFIVFWALIIVLSLIVMNFGSKNKYGMDIFGSEKRDTVGTGSSNSYNYSHSTEDIYDIDIRWQSGKIELKTGNSDEFRITETSAKELDHSNRLTIDGEDGSLLIRWDEQTGIGEFLRGQYDKDLIIEIPADFGIELLKISTVYGEVSLNGLEASELKINSTSADVKLQDSKAYDMKLKTDSGEISLMNVMAENMKLVSTSGAIEAENSVGYTLKLDSVSGDIAFVGSFEKLTAASVDGDLTLFTAVLPKQLELAAVSGNVELTIPENSDIPVELKSIAGEIDTAFEELDISNFPEQDANEEKDKEEEKPILNIKTTSGNIKLIKGEKAVKLAEIFPEESADE